MDIVSLLDTLLTSVFKAEKDFFDNPKNFSNLEASVKSSTEAFAASFLGAILSEMDQAIRKSTWREQRYAVHRNDTRTLVSSVGDISFKCTYFRSLTDKSSLMKLHPVSGFRIISNIHWNRNITVGAKFHHERYDGKGYPDGRTGENIPEIARIIGVADAYDAMTSNRSYRDAMPQEKVRAEIEKGRGTQFDPECADIMLSIIDEDKDYELRQKNEEVRKILVVDSEKINCEIIRSFFSDRPDMEFFMAQTGEESLQIVLEERVDLILIGLVLPDMDGFSATEKLREYTQAPIVLASGDRTIETFYKALDRGAADFITKPFQREVVKEVVFSILGLIETLK